MIFRHSATWAAANALLEAIAKHESGELVARFAGQLRKAMGKTTGNELRKGQPR